MSGADTYNHRFFTDVMDTDSRDAQDRLFLTGYIESCRKWRETRSEHAIKYYAHYLFQDQGNPESYRELCELVKGDFIADKIQYLNSVFSVIPDVEFLTQSSKLRQDYHHYGLSLGLQADFWEQGMAQVDSGLVLYQARKGEFQEAIDNALYDRNSLDAFYLLLKILDTVDKRQEDVIADIADALLGCVRKMDNEGTRAHHIHRALYAIRLKDEEVAKEICKECLEIASQITDAFQCCVAHLLLNQQVALLDLGLAEHTTQFVTGTEFAGEECGALCALAALGRGREPKEDRIERLERLLERGKGLPVAYCAFEAVVEISLEIFWERKDVEAFQSVVECITSLLAENDDIKRAIDAVFVPEPIRVNNATVSYVERDEGEIGYVPSRHFVDALQIVLGKDPKSLKWFLDLVNVLVDRLVEMEEKQKELSEHLALKIKDVAVALGKDIGSDVLGFFEQKLDTRFEPLILVSCGVDIAEGWYILDVPEKAVAIHRQCMSYVDMCNEEIGDAFENPDKIDSFMDALRTLADSSRRLSGEPEIPSANQMNLVKEKLIRKLLRSLAVVPCQHRLDMFQTIEGVLEGNLTLSGFEEKAALALADVDLDLSYEIINRLDNKYDRLSAQKDLAKQIGEKDSDKAVEMLDQIARQDTMQDVAEAIDEICTALNEIQVPKDVWHQIVSCIQRLDECPERTSAIHMCAVRVAEYSIQEAALIVDTELEDCALRKTTQYQYLQILQGFLHILDNRCKDVEVIISRCRERELSLGMRTGELLRHQVAPCLAHQDSELAIEVLQASGEIEDDLSAVSDAIGVLLDGGHQEPGVALIRQVPSIVDHIPEEDRQTALLMFYKTLADHALLQNTETSEDIKRCLFDKDVGDDIQKELKRIFIVSLSSQQPLHALSLWLETFDDVTDFDTVISRSARVDFENTLETILGLPDGAQKSRCLAELYATEACRTNPSFPVPYAYLPHCEDEDEQSYFLSCYINVMPDDDFENLMNAIQNISDPDARMNPIEQLIERFGSKRKDEVLDVIKESVGLYGENELDDDDDDDKDGKYDYEFKRWACLACTLCLDAGIEILHKIVSSFTKRMTSSEFFEQGAEIPIETWREMLSEYDEFDRQHMISEVADKLSEQDLQKGLDFIEEMDDLLDADDKSDCIDYTKKERARYLCKQYPDLVLQEIVMFSDRNHQRTCMKDLLGLIEGASDIEVKRWDCLVHILDHWVQQAWSPELGGDFDWVGDIIPFAPEIVHERLMRVPDSPEKINICKNLLHRIKTKDHICLLEMALNAQAKSFEHDYQDSLELSMKARNEFLETLNDLIQEWDTEILDGVISKIIQAIVPLTECGDHRNDIVLQLLKRASLECLDVGQLLNMIDDMNVLNRASDVVVERTPMDQLQDLMPHLRETLTQHHTPEKEVLRILGSIVEKDVGLEGVVRQEGASSETSLAFQLKVLALLGGSYSILRCLLKNDQVLILEIFRLVHKALVPNDPNIDRMMAFALDFNNKDDRGLGAEEAGKLLGDLLLMHHSSLADGGDDACFIDLVTKGNKQEMLPPLIGPSNGRFQDSDACHFFGAFLKKLNRHSGSIKPWIEDCFQAVTKSYDDPVDCLVDLSLLMEDAESLNEDIRYLLAQAILAWSELAIDESDEIKEMQPFLRIYLATELLGPRYFDKCIEWVNVGVQDFLAHSMEEGLSQEFFSAMTRIGYALGKVVVDVQDNTKISASVDAYIWHILLRMAELEDTLHQVAKEEDMEAVMILCQQVVEDLQLLEQAVIHQEYINIPDNTDARREKLLGSVLNILKHAVSKVDNSIEDPMTPTKEDEETLEYELGHTQYLNVFSGALWKIGLKHLDAKGNEIVDLMCRLAEHADIEELEAESTLTKINQRYEIELFIRSLVEIDREKAPDLVKVLNDGVDEIIDLGLFGACLEEDPEWVFLTAESMGEGSDLAYKMEALIRQLGDIAPQKLSEVGLLLEAMADRHGWTFQTHVLEALSIGRLNVEHYVAEDRKGVPEFWARSNVTATLAKKMWETEPLKALEIAETIEIEKVRCDTFIDLSRRVDLQSDFDLSVLKKLMSIYQTLDDVRLRFDAAKESLPLLFLLSGNDDRLAVSFTFLELFATAPKAWLSLAYVHVVPVLYKDLNSDTLSVLGNSMQEIID